MKRLHTTMSIKRTIIATAAIVTSVAMVAPSFAGAVTVQELMAQIAALQAQLMSMSGASTTPAACVGVTFTRNLTVGSTGNDVKCLQALLNVTPQSGYFGPLTLGAVRSYQASKGYVPANQVGPLTRASLNAQLAVSTNPGTGTGTPGSGTGTVGLTGTASIKEINDMSAYSLEDVGEGMNNVTVLGREIEMDNTGSARLQQVRVKFDHAGGTEVANSSTRLENYASKVSVMLNGTEIASASPSEFNRDSTGVYTKTFITNSSALLNSGAKNNLTIAVSAVSNLDSGDESEQWDVNVENIRYVDGTGAVITDTSTGELETAETFTFVTLATSTDLELKLVAGSDNPVAQTVKVSTTTTTDNLTLITFTMKAQGDKIWIDELPVVLTTSDDKVTDVVSKITLKIGSSTFSETLPTSGTNTDCDNATSCIVTFDDMDMWISANQTVTGSVVVEAKKLDAYSEGTTLTAAIGAYNRENIVAEDVNGDTIATSSRTGVVTGEAQKLRSTGVMLSNFTSSAVAATDTSGTTQSQTYTVSFKVTAFGDTAYMPNIISRGSSTTAGLIYLVENSSGNSVVPPTVTISNSVLSSSATLNSSSLYEIPDGESRTFTGTIQVQDPTTAGFYRIQLDSVQFDTDSTDTTPDSTESFTPANRFETPGAKID